MNIWSLRSSLDTSEPFMFPGILSIHGCYCAGIEATIVRLLGFSSWFICVLDGGMGRLFNHLGPSLSKL